MVWTQHSYYEPRNNILWLKTIIWVTGVLRRTLVGDWGFGTVRKSRLDSEDGLCTGCRNVSRHQQSLLRIPNQSPHKVQGAAINKVTRATTRLLELLLLCITHLSKQIEELPSELSEPQISWSKKQTTCLFEQNLKTNKRSLCFMAQKYGRENIMKCNWVFIFFRIKSKSCCHNWLQMARLVGIQLKAYTIYSVWLFVSRDWHNLTTRTTFYDVMNTIKHSVALHLIRILCWMRENTYLRNLTWHMIFKVLVWT